MTRASRSNHGTVEPKHLHHPRAAGTRSPTLSLQAGRGCSPDPTWTRSFRTVVVLIAAACVAAFPAAASGSLWGPSAGARPSVSAAAPLLNEQILAEINSVRAAHLLPALQQANGLAAAAAAHSREMIDAGLFAHSSPNGEEFWRRIERYYPRVRFRQWLVGETILWISPDADARTVVQKWLDSPPHRQILLGGEWREIGVSAQHVSAAPGVFGGQPATVVTADFGVRAG